MSGRVDGQVAIVTGAARGIGRACAVRLAQEGADLMLLDIGVVRRLEGVEHPLGTPAELEHTADLARSHGATVVTRFVDVRDGAALRAAADAAQSTFGSVDITVAAAGVLSSSPAWELSDLQWRTVLEINLTGAWQTAKAVAPLMIAQGRGSIILIGSTSAYRPAAGAVHESAARHGLVGLARGFARELAQHHVRANTIDPGAVATEVTLRSAARDEQHPTVPRVEPEDVANAALFLASNEARCITGTSLIVDLGALLDG